MTSTSASGGGCLLRALKAYALFVLACIALSVSLGYLAAGCAVRRAERAWAERAQSMESFAARYPTQADSPAGVKLDELTRPLGIQMVGRYAKETSAAAKAQTEFLQSLGRVLGDCERSKTERCPALSHDVEAFLQREASRLDTIETHVLQAGPLHWALDLSKGNGSPLPHLLGHRQLSSVLLTRAMSRAARDAADAAERSLEATWVLNGSFAERPELISQLIAVAVSGMENGVLRTLRKPSGRWLPRMRERAYTDIRSAYQLEAWNWTRFTNGQWGVFDVSYMEDNVTPPPSVTGSIGRALTTPYVRLSFAGVSEALLGATERLRSVKRCDFDVDAYSKEFEDSFPRWNILGRIATPAVVRGFTSMQMADLDGELTERVLAARAGRQATGRWPADPVASRVCEGLVWEARAEGGGALTISASEKPFAKADPNRLWSMRLSP